MPSVYERVKKVVVAQLEVDEKIVTPAAKFVEDLGADSLGLVELTMSLEDEFTSMDKKVEITDSDSEKIHTVQDAVDFIKSKGISD